MLRALSKKWWVLLLNGICAIAFGVLAFVWPGVTLMALVMLYGIYCLADALTALTTAFQSKDDGKPWGKMLFIGIVSILAALAAFIWPGITSVVLLMMIAVWAIVRGLFEIMAAIELRKVIQHEWLLILAGLVSVIFGIVLIARPAVGALSVVWVIGTFTILHGLLLVGLAFRLRSAGHERRGQPAGA